MQLFCFNKKRFSKYETRANNIKYGLGNYFDVQKREEPLNHSRNPSMKTHTRNLSTEISIKVKAMNFGGFCIESKGNKALEDSIIDDMV